MTCTQKGCAMIQTVTTLLRENKNLVYVAIIVICLSITTLSKLGELAGFWTNIT